MPHCAGRVTILELIHSRRVVFKKPDTRSPDRAKTTHGKLAPVRWKLRTVHLPTDPAGAESGQTTSEKLSKEVQQILRSPKQDHGSVPWIRSSRHLDHLPK